MKARIGQGTGRLLRGSLLAVLLVPTAAGAGRVTGHGAGTVQGTTTMECSLGVGGQRGQVNCRIADPWGDVLGIPGAAEVRVHGAVTAAQVAADGSEATFSGSATVEVYVRNDPTVSVDPTATLSVVVALPGTQAGTLTLNLSSVFLQGAVTIAVTGADVAIRP